MIDTPPVMSARRRRLFVSTLVTLVTMTGVISSLGAPLVPTIAADFEVSLSTAQWLLTAPFLVAAVCTPLFGRMSDLGVQRALLIVGMVIVILGTIIAALAPGIVFLLVGRTMQGVGIALSPVAMTLARRYVEPRRAGGVIALLSVSAVAGIGFGYPISALIAEMGGVAAAYWVGAVIAALTLLLTILVVPSTQKTRAISSLDWTGAGLLATASTTLLLAITQGATWGWISPSTLGLILASVVLTGLWLRRSLMVEDPLVNLKVATRREVVGAHLTAFLAGTGTYLMVALVVIMVQASTDSGPGLGGSIKLAGLALSPYAFASVLSSRIAAVFGTRIRQTTWLPIGCALYLTATAQLAFWHDDFVHILLAMLVAGIGSGFTFAAIPGLIISATPPEETGSTLAFNQVLRYLGFSLGSTLCTVIIDLANRGERGLTTSAYNATLIITATAWSITLVMTAALSRRKIS